MPAVAEPGAAVLVIGAGPAGLFAAVLPAGVGIPVRVVEREPRYADRWRGLVDVIVRADEDQRPDAILIRPDGHVGFVASPAGPAGLAALDAHLSAYLSAGWLRPGSARRPQPS